jgi:hypothetical protein
MGNALSISEQNSHAVAVVQAGLLAFIDVCGIHNLVVVVKVGKAGNGQQLMMLYFLTGDWS